ncbi:hypothetical protein [Undibacterium aquatile]|nr:hypothetical protein [Undibacterium aquatile]
MSIRYTQNKAAFKTPLNTPFWHESASAVGSAGWLAICGQIR